jgi:hypothetical protein
MDLPWELRERPYRQSASLFFGLREVGRGAGVPTKHILVWTAVASCSILAVKLRENLTVTLLSGGMKDTHHQELEDLGPRPYSA